mgnify:CR=1 FL=1
MLIAVNTCARQHQKNIQGQTRPNLTVDILSGDHLTIKMFINDNDGDFVIIDSKHKKYNIIKNKRLKDRKSKKTKKL